MRESDTMTVRTHRVGSITTGLCMVVYGILLLMHTLFDMISYEIIFSLWPLILISLGVELLLSNWLKREIIYDKAAVFLLIIMTFLAMGLACADVCIEASMLYWKSGM